MRTIVSIIVASVLFLLVIYLAFSGNIVWLDFWTGLSIALIPVALAILYWGLKPQIQGLFKGKSKTQQDKITNVLLEQETNQKSATPLAKTSFSIEKKNQSSVLLPDRNEITKLNITDGLLDQIYEQAQTQAITMYYDAQLSSFTIQVFPFQDVGASVNIYFSFYSKWVNKTCTFRYSDFQPQVEHTLPDKRARSDYDKQIFNTLPWRESPQWLQFLGRVYVRIKPIPPAKSTCYHLNARAYSKNTPWRVTFEDGFSGNEYVFEWDGKGLDENSIKQVS